MIPAWSSEERRSRRALRSLLLGSGLGLLAVLSNIPKGGGVPPALAGVESAPSCEECTEYGPVCTLDVGAHGRVTDKSTGEPISGAAVIVSGLPEVFTDEDGGYDASGSRGDTGNIDYYFSLAVSADGYAPFEIDGYFSEAIHQYDVELTPLETVPSPTPTPDGPILQFGPLIPHILCNGDFDLDLGNVGPADKTLVIDDVVFAHGYSQGYYGRDFTWDLSGVTFPVTLAEGESISIPVSYRGSSGPYAFPSRLHVTVRSNAARTDPVVFSPEPGVFLLRPYYGELCPTPTPDSDEPDLLPSAVRLYAPPVGCLVAPGPVEAHNEICIRNQGGTAAGSFNVVVQRGGSVFEYEFDVAGVDAGDEVCVLQRYTPGEVQVTVDGRQEIAESDENNNTATFSLPFLTPPPACSPSPTPTAPTDTPPTGPSATATPSATRPPNPASSPSATATSGPPTATWTATPSPGGASGCSTGSHGGPSAVSLLALALALALRRWRFRRNCVSAQPLRAQCHRW